MALEVTQIHGLFDSSNVLVLTAEISDAAVACLTPLEEACVAGAVHKRRREFATGRSLARYALDRYFGIRDFDLIKADDRSPIWPRGVAGSLSHSDTRAWIAVVDASCASVGIDGEDRAELDPRFWRMVLLEAEVEYLNSIEPSQRNRRALVLFSAKESLFKAQYPRTGQFLGFKAVQVHLLETGRIDCVFQDPVGPFRAGDVCQGRWRDDGCVLTCVWIPAP
ncbi:MAG: 4'-phosphopantetheinyl transferase EntD [Gammaproteobacteria bacterium]|jgi:4'-phosphopantetheinyl transferase EntD